MLGRVSGTRPVPFQIGPALYPTDSPIESDLQNILCLSTPDVKALSITDFLSRSKLAARLETACKDQTEAEIGERKK